MDTWKGKLRSAQHAVLELSNIKGLEKAIYREKKPDHHSLPYIFFGSDISLNSWSPCKVFVKKKKKVPLLSLSILYIQIQTQVPLEVLPFYGF